MSRTVDAPYLFVAEVATLLGLHPSTVRAAIHRGELPAIRVGSAYKVPATALGLEAPPAPSPAPRWEQLELFTMAPVRVWRNTGKPVHPKKT